MSFHHAARSRIPDIDNTNAKSHDPALFIVELAGYGPCLTTAGDLFWDRVTSDPMQGSPDPPCAAKPLPGPLVSAQGQGRVPRQTPGFQVDTASVSGRNGPINWNVQGDSVEMSASTTPFELNAQVTLTGDRREFPNYEIGYVQTITKSEETFDYVSGHRASFLLPVPVRDGPPANFANTVPPWFDSRFNGIPDAATGVATTHMKDSPSSTAALEFEPNDALDRMEKHIVFNNWLVARRRDAPLDRFNTFFLDGTIIDFRQSADVIKETGTGTFRAGVGTIASSSDQTSMQLSGPTPADIPQARKFSASKPRPRASAGGLSHGDFIRRVNQIAEPHRRLLGLLGSMTASIEIDKETGRLVLDTRTLTGHAITIKTDAKGVTAGSLEQLARAIFPEVRKLAIAPITGGETRHIIPVSFNPLAP
jgi:hypothetical protein